MSYDMNLAQHYARLGIPYPYATQSPVLPTPALSPGNMNPLMPSQQNIELGKAWAQTESGKRILSEMEKDFNDYVSAKQNPAAKESLEKTKAMEEKINVLIHSQESTDKKLESLADSLNRFVAAVTPHKKEG